MTTILLTDPRSTPERVAALREAHPEVEFVVAERRDAVGVAVADADAVFGSLTKDEFSAAKRLRWVQSPGAGVEWVAKIPAIIESDVVITNTRGAHAATIAEHTFALLLSLTRRLRDFAAFQEREEWGRGQINDRMVGIKGLTMGIVGFGNIGRAIARRASAFEMGVLAVDAQRVPGNDGVAEVWPLDQLPDLCRQSDVLVIVVPSTPETRNMIGAEQISQMKRGSYLLAMSRGGIVNEIALRDALESGQLAGAGLDVTAVEPLPPGDPLWRAPNLVITPHNSPASQLTTDLMWSILSDNIGRFLRGEQLVNVVDKQRGY